MTSQTGLGQFVKGSCLVADVSSNPQPLAKTGQTHKVEKLMTDCLLTHLEDALAADEVTHLRELMPVLSKAATFLTGVALKAEAAQQTLRTRECASNRAAFRAALKAVQDSDVTDISGDLALVLVASWGDVKDQFKVSNIRDEEVSDDLMESLLPLFNWLLYICRPDVESPFELVEMMRFMSDVEVGSHWLACEASRVVGPFQFHL